MAVDKRFALPVLFVGLALLCGCGKEADDASAAGPSPAMPAKAAPSPETVASHAGGTISLGEVEDHLRQTLRPAGAAADELVTAYRQAAETLAVRRHVSNRLGDPIELLKQRGEYRHRQRQAVLELFLEERAADAVEVSEAEARAFYDDHREQFRQAPQRFAWHIFRRHRDPGESAETDALLRDLKRRIQAGEPFAELARQHSHSESRISGGRLGWIGRDQMDPSLDGPLFALQEGDISDPLPVPGGAVLFYVTEVRQEKQHPFEDVRDRIFEQLEERWRRSVVAGRVEGLEAPVGSMVLDREALESRLQAGDGDAVILEIGDLRLTAADFARRLAEVTDGRTSGERVAELYRHQVEDELLFRDLTASGWAESDGRGATLRQRIVADGVPWMVESWLEEQMRGRVEGAGDELRAFHRDNRHLYQSSLRFKLRTLSIAAETGASGKMVEIERLRERLLAGEIAFTAAAGELGADVTDLGWRDFEQLSSLPAKARTHVLALDSVGFTVPYYLDQRLYLTWVEDREEPAPLTYDQAESRVRQDYYQRFQQRLYRQVVDEILAQEQFHFYEEAVYRALSLPDERPQPAQGS